MIRKRKSKPFGSSLFLLYQIRAEAAYLYDAVHLYAEALVACVENGGDPKNGSYIINAIKGRRYQSAMGWDNKINKKLNFPFKSFQQFSSPYWWEWRRWWKLYNPWNEIYEQSEDKPKHLRFISCRNFHNKNKSEWQHSGKIVEKKGNGTWKEIYDTEREIGSFIGDKRIWWMGIVLKLSH